jgi:hypothetical protein
MGLRANDLQEMVLDTFEIDSFQSKMGEDKDVCVISFIAKERSPARDMMEFIEKGYNFVLDSDVSAGEDLAENIHELVSGITKLTGDMNWKFKYYKNNNVYEFAKDKINSIVPKNSSEYSAMMETRRVNSIESFFKQTYKDTIVVEGNRVTVNKPFGINFAFDILEFGDKKDIQSQISETIKVDTKSTAQIMWLTKLLGDFNITKYGEEFVLENGNRAMKIKFEG